MSFSRRDFLKTTGGIAVGAALGESQRAQAQVKPEAGAKLRVLRWKRFVQGDEDAWMANTRKFSEQTGVEIRVDNENWEDIRPKAAVAANIGTGPDIILSTNDDSHQYPDKLLDVSDVCEYLGKKYGPWYSSALAYGKNEGRWIAVPLGSGGNCMNYRESHLKAAGFKEFPKDTAGFLKLCQALKKNGTPPVSRSATRRATRTRGVTGCCGRSAARWSTRATRSRSTPRRLPPRSSSRRSCIRRSCPEHCRGSIRTTTRHSCRARSASPTTASRSTTREDLDRSGHAGDREGHPARQLSIRAGGACDRICAVLHCGVFKYTKYPMPRRNICAS
jgi:hypothetical protein